MTSETLLNTVRDALAIFTEKTGTKAECYLHTGGCGAYCVNVFIGENLVADFSVSQTGLAFGEVVRVMVMSIAFPPFL